MVLSEQEREQKINDFLARKFKQYNIRNRNIASLEAKLFGSFRKL